MSLNKLQRRFTAAHAAHRAGCLDAAVTGYAKIFAESPALNDFLHRIGDSLGTEEPEKVGLSLRSLLGGLPGVYGAALHYGAIAARQLHAASREMKLRSSEQLAEIDQIADRLMALSVILAPSNSAALYNFAKAKHDKGDLAGARDLYRAAARYGPDQAHVWAKLGECLMDMGDVANGEACWNRAMAFPSDAADTSYNLSFLYLLRGDYAQGWALHEARWQCPDFLYSNGRDYLTAPVWAGDSLEGRTILVRHEQGNGDQIQFGRYIPLLEAAGGRVVVEVQRGLVRLFRLAFPGRTVIGLGEEVPPHDVQIPFMSLPYHFTKALDQVPAPLVIPGQDLTGKLGATVARIQSMTGWRVGLTWAGSATHVNDAKRSAPDDLLSALADTPGVTWVNLQVGPRSEAFARVGAARLNPTRALQDFADTAALIRSLDLVVTVDTAVAHLAGSLGVPTWILLPFNAEWRWLRHRADTPWYPSARLLRQPAPGAWTALATQVREELAARPLPTREAA